MKQLPAEAKKFKSVDGVWRSLMSKAKVDANVMSNCLPEGLYDKIMDANKNLDAVTKGLNE
jgi:hypothetical protein